MDNKPTLEEAALMWGMKYNIKSDDLKRMVAESCCKYPRDFVRDHYLKELGYGTHNET